MKVTVKRCFGEPILEVMNFLNEVVLDYPKAVSFAPGRPAEDFFDVEASLEEVAVFVAYRAERLGWSREQVYSDLGQYNKTNGIIQELVARQLELDEGIHVDPSSILITSGCQEGMAILLAGLFEAGRDVLLSSDPTYIGITGLARILGIEVEPLSSGENGLDPEVFARAVARVRVAGKVPRALYDVPDFNNPLGSSMPLEARRRMLEIAHREGVLIFEDNPYGMFAYDGEARRTLKALDQDRTVIYMGSFSKTLYPGLRVGFLVVDQEGAVEGGASLPLIDALSQVKSLVTVNTPPLVQAVVGGTLLRSGGSLKPAMAPKIEFYRRNRDRMLETLEHWFGDGSELARMAPDRRVRWKRPEGGFFLTLDVPFDFGGDDVVTCGRDFGVICCPMSFFSLTRGRERQIRLAFSYVSPEEIDQGMERLARYMGSRLVPRDAAGVEPVEAAGRA